MLNCLVMIKSDNVKESTKQRTKGYDSHKFKSYKDYRRNVFSFTLTMICFFFRYIWVSFLLCIENCELFREA